MENLGVYLGERLKRFLINKKTNTLSLKIYFSIIIIFGSIGTWFIFMPPPRYTSYINNLIRIISVTLGVSYILFGYLYKPSVQMGEKHSKKVKRLIIIIGVMFLLSGIIELILKV